MITKIRENKKNTFLKNEHTFLFDEAFEEILNSNSAPFSTTNFAVFSISKACFLVVG